MRWLVASAAFTIAAIGAAHAAPVTIAPVTFSSEFQEQLDDELGAREGEVLSSEVVRAVNAALQRRGVSENATPLRIEITIIDADPNRPTFEQLSARPDLSYIDSVSVGGAELHAVLRGSDGAVLDEVSHRHFNSSLADLNYWPGTWSEAQRSIRRFANRVADAAAAQARAP